MAAVAAPNLAQLNIPLAPPLVSQSRMLGCGGIASQLPLLPACTPFPPLVSDLAAGSIAEVLAPPLKSTSASPAELNFRDMLCLLQMPEDIKTLPSFSAAAVGQLLEAVVGKDAAATSPIVKAWRSRSTSRESSAAKLRDTYGRLTPTDVLQAEAAALFDGKFSKPLVAGASHAEALLAAVQKKASSGAKGCQPEGLSKALQAAMATNSSKAGLDGLDEFLRNRPDDENEAETYETECSVPPPPGRCTGEATSGTLQLGSEEPADTQRAAVQAFFIGSGTEVGNTSGRENASAPSAGFAMTSMLNRAAENAKRAAQSQKAAGEATASAQCGSAALAETAVANKEREAQFMIFIGSIPMGTGEGLLTAECLKYGPITSTFYQSDPESLLEDRWALIRFSDSSCAKVAVERMSRRVGLFGATANEPLKIRIASLADIDRMMQSKASVAVPVPAPPAPSVEATATVNTNAAQRVRDQPVVTSGGRRRGGRARSRSRRRRSRKRDRRRRRSDTSSNKSSSVDLPRLPATAGAIVVSDKDQKSRGFSGFDAAPALGEPAALPGVAPATVERPIGGRQVGTRGNWSEYALPDGRSYYVNIITKEASWTRPGGYDAQASRRGATGIPGPAADMGQGHSNLFVGNLPAGIDELSFRQLFAAYGNVCSAKVVMEQRYGFVKYASMAEAQRVIDNTNGAVINGVQLAVRFANMDRR